MLLKLTLEVRDQIGLIGNRHALPAQGFELSDKGVFKLLFGLGVHKASIFTGEKEKQGRGLDEHLLQKTLLEGLRMLELLSYQLNLAVECSEEVCDFALLVGVRE